MYLCGTRFSLIKKTSLRSGRACRRDVFCLCVPEGDGADTHVGLRPQYFIREASNTHKQLRLYKEVRKHHCEDLHRFTIMVDVQGIIKVIIPNLLLMTND